MLMRRISLGRLTTRRDLCLPPLTPHPDQTPSTIKHCELQQFSRPGGETAVFILIPPLILPPLVLPPDLFASVLDHGLSFFVFDPPLFRARRRFGGNTPFFLLQPLFQQFLHFTNDLGLVGQLSPMHLGTYLQETIRIYLPAQLPLQRFLLHRGKKRRIPDGEIPLHHGLDLVHVLAAFAAATRRLENYFFYNLDLHVILDAGAGPGGPPQVRPTAS
jgi:hypothetical protein